MFSRGKRQRDTRPQHVRAGDQAVDREERGDRLKRSVRGGDWRPLCRARVQAHDGVGLLAGGEQRIPHPAVQAADPALGGQLGEADRLETARGIAAYLLGRELRVGEPRQLQRDYPLRVAAGPHLEMPVVPGPQCGQPQLEIVTLPEHRAGEPGDQRGEVQRGPDAGQVHVGDPGVDVPTAAAHLVEPGGFHAPFLVRPSDHRVEPDIRILPVLIAPHLASVVGLDDLGRAVGQRGGKPADEHVGRLDDVIVDRDQDMLSLPGIRVRQQRHT